ncbi:helix-turn-helix domain-containing protein [Labrenzia sp. CE80]|uniref:helix-turn-helix domain-containing protein n=1 Tax=Labrenzia sp. CE80 TaxID=1788986 RepID=UPI00129A573A|nr:helix-turn-helix domain-containing protein [Labrenzia sp. CE80]
MSDCREGSIPQRPIYGPGGLTSLLARNRTAAHLHLAEGYVARAYCIQPTDLYRTTRGKAHMAEARQLVMYLAHVEIGMPLINVARHYRRDRSTVAHACRGIEERREDPIFDELVGQIERLISMRQEMVADLALGGVQ